MSLNADRTPEEAQARLTALLLGELPSEEEAAVRQEIQTNVDLAGLEGFHRLAGNAAVAGPALLRQTSEACFFTRQICYFHVGAARKLWCY